MSNIREKENEVAISRLQHSILEKELKLMKKIDEVDRLKNELENAKKVLAEKLETKE